MKESEIEMMIGHYLEYSAKLCFYKQHTRGFFDTRVGHFKKDRSPYARNGLPDFVVIYRGFHCGLEVKRLKGRQAPSQIEMERYLKEKGGAQYFVVRGLDDVKKHLLTFTDAVDKIYLGASSTKTSE